MNIWTEQLERRHLPIVEAWLGRRDGALTPNALPENAAALPGWFEDCAAEAGRLDCLVLVYETPVGLAGLRRQNGRETAAELYLLLCEKNYNPLRTATYAALRMLDRAFLELGLERVKVRACARCGWFLEALEKMGFVRETEEEDLVGLAVEKADYLDRKYLF